MGKPHRILRDSSPERPSSSAHEEDGGERRFAIFLDPRHRLAERHWQFFFYRTQRLIQFEIGIMLAGGADHEQSQFGPGDLRIKSLQNRQWVFNIRAAPGSSGLGHSEVTARS